MSSKCNSWSTPSHSGCHSDVARSVACEDSTTGFICLANDVTWKTRSIAETTSDSNTGHTPRLSQRIVTNEIAVYATSSATPRTIVRVHQRSMSAALLNARPVTNKAITIHEFFTEHEIDILAITETWLKTSDKAIIVELTPTGYGTRRRCCNYPKENVIVRRLPTTNLFI